MKPFRSFTFTTVTLFIALVAVSVGAETINCTPITSLPATIDTQLWVSAPTPPGVG